MSKRNNSRRVASIVVIVLIVVAMLFTTVQIIAILPKPEKTTRAEIHIQRDVLTVPGIVLREEQIISQPHQGQLDFHYQNGVKVPKGTSVASVYAKDSDVYMARQVASLTAEIAMLEESAKRDPSNANYSTLVWEMMAAIAEDTHQGRYADAEQKKTKLTELLGLRNAAAGKGSDFSSRIDQLKAQLAQLQANPPAVVSEIVAPEAGFYVNQLDGYENFASLEDVQAMNAADLLAILKEPTRQVAGGDGAGKIIVGYEWYFATIVPNSQVSALRALAFAGRTNKGEEKVPLAVSFKQPVLLNATLFDVRPRGNEEETIVIFRCSEINEDLVTMRRKNVDIVFGEYRGLRIPKEAIRINEKDEQGVWIYIGADVEFRKIDIIYEDSAYVYSAIHDQDTRSQRSYLQRDDEVLLDSREYG